jgi:hypothetical protein
MDVLVIVFWVVVVNPLVGYLIGQRKNNGAVSMMISFLLGPVGWLIAAVYSGNLRKCPFCSEHIKPDAKVCRYCGRDLPEPAGRAGFRPAPTLSATPNYLIWILVSVGVAVALIIFLPIIWRTKDDFKTPRSSLDQTNEVLAKEADANQFHDEPQTLYVKITRAVTVSTTGGPVDLQPGMLVRVIARNAQLTRVQLDTGEATIPLSTTDIPGQ